MNQSANPIAWDYFYYILNMTPLKKKTNLRCSVQSVHGDISTAVQIYLSLV